MRRKDILSCDYFINFLEIEKYFPEILRKKPVSIDTKTFNQVRINDIILLEEKKFYFYYVMTWILQVEWIHICQKIIY